MTQRLFIGCLLATLFMVPVGTRGADAPGTPAGEEPRVVDFNRDVKPIFAKHCSSCHGPGKQKGGLRLDRKADALAGGDSGIAFMPGRSADSLLLKRVTSREDGEKMPPKGEPLTAKQIATLRAWVEQGAKWPDDAPVAEHWAFKPIVRPNIPADANPIDHLIRAKLRDNGLSLSPEADRRTLIRRLKLDLLGLPPTPEEAAAFVKDPDPRAYEKLVERYLASPRFGERQARHWLDVVRFAESNGFEMNQERPTAWHYRDWVIRAFNDDMPYDRFITEQLAGDGPATGFLVGGPWDQVKSPDPVLTANQRADELHDIVGTTGSAFLGLTIGCARCHNHKFDPVSQIDYYRLKAVFAGVQHGERPMRAVVPAPQVAALRARLKNAEAALAALEPLADPQARTPRRLPVNALGNSERFAPITARAVRFTVFATNSVEPCIDELEVFTTGPESRNVALLSNRAIVRSSGNYAGSPSIHRLEFLNDGRYGNSHSWISNERGRGWVEVTFKEPAEINRIAWARDREGVYADRLAVRYRIEVQTGDDAWVEVASSDDRAPSSATPAAMPAGSSLLQRALWSHASARVAELRTAIANASRAPTMYAGRFTAPEPTFRLNRGDATQPKEPVGPGVLSSFGAKLDIPANAPESDRRRALARWITHPGNPLTARVIVNRLWQHHFGTGILDTPSDLGRNGGKPTHPELLDWLASELIAPVSGRSQPDAAGGSPWSLKHIHRLIATSATYRQASTANTAGIAKDAQSRLLWRYPPQRLEAEAVRDSILSVSGKLDLTPGGPGFTLFEPNANYVRVYTPKTSFGPAEFRRMIYMRKIRMHLDDTFGAFDCPDAGQVAPRRNASTTPLQALNLLNSPFLVQQAEFFAERVRHDAGAAADAQVARAFRLAFQREPAAKERAAAAELVQHHGLAALCRALLNANEFLYVD